MIWDLEITVKNWLRKWSMSSRLLSSILDLRNIVENYDTKGPVDRAKRTKDFSLYFDVSPATGRDAVIVKASHAKYPRATRRGVSMPIWSGDTGKFRVYPNFYPENIRDYVLWLARVCSTDRRRPITIHPRTCPSSFRHTRSLCCLVKICVRRPFAWPYF